MTLIIPLLKLLLLLILFTAVVAWLWLCLLARKSNPVLKILGWVAINLSLIAFIYENLRGHSIYAWLVALFPPFFLMDIRDSYRNYSAGGSEFISSVFELEVGIFLLVLTIFLMWEALRRYAPVLAFLVATVATVFFAEIKSRELMCDRAQVLGLDGFKRNSFFWSLGNAPREFQFQVHGYGEKGGMRFAWSYSELDWYPLNDETGASVHKDPFICK